MLAVPLLTRAMPAPSMSAGPPGLSVTQVYDKTGPDGLAFTAVLTAPSTDGGARKQQPGLQACAEVNCGCRELGSGCGLAAYA